MEEVILKLQEAMEIKSTLVKQEAALWQKILEAMSSYLNQQQMTKEKGSAPTAPHRPTPVNIYMNSKQAAEYLGLSAGTLAKWRCIGGGPQYMKIGYAVRYKADDLNDFAGKRYPHTSAYEKLIYPNRP